MTSSYNIVLNYIPNSVIESAVNLTVAILSKIKSRHEHHNNEERIMEIIGTEMKIILSRDYKVSCYINKYEANLIRYQALYDIIQHINDDFNIYGVPYNGSVEWMCMVTRLNRNLDDKQRLFMKHLFQDRTERIDIHQIQY
jgi:hypothetical protein